LLSFQIPRLIKNIIFDLIDLFFVENLNQMGLNQPFKVIEKIKKSDTLAKCKQVITH